MPERYGIEVDDTSAMIIDRLEEAFDSLDVWDIEDGESLALSNNRYLDIQKQADDTVVHSEGKVPRDVFLAVRSAECNVAAIHTGLKDEGYVRVWVEYNGLPTDQREQIANSMGLPDDNRPHGL